jgi:imidazoleglycerol phosphate dehydratase HisB
MPRDVEAQVSHDLRGKILAFNLDAQGHVDGVLVETPTGTMRIQLPRHGVEAFARSMRVGSRVDLHVEEVDGDGAHHEDGVGGGEGEDGRPIARVNF